MIYRIGHKGAAGYEFGNSISSIIKAIEFDVDFIEIDVQTTKDGTLVVFHDYFLNGLTNGDGLLVENTFEEIQHLRLKNGDPILTFEYLCQFCSSRNLKLLVELKNEDIALKAIRILDQHYASNTDYIISSFFHNQLLEVKLNNINVKTCIIFEGYPIDMEAFIIKSRADYVSLGYESVSDNMLNTIKKLNIKIILWTVDNIYDIKNALKMMPDGIISNFPDRIPKF